MESRRRSLIKTISWRITATVLTWITLFGMTGKAGDSAKFAIVIAIINMLAYYCHERSWNQLKWERD